MHSVLVIDDDDTILDLTAEILTYAGYAVATAVDGPEGLVSAQTQRPDLVLCDIMLPSFDGLEVARRLRADPACRSVPIVLMSGAEQSASTMSSYDAFVAKPFGLAHLLDVVGQCIAGALPPGYIGPLPLHGRRGTPWRAGLG